MKTQVSRSFNYAFSLTEQELRRICDIAVQQMKRAVGTEKFTTIFRLKFKNDFEAEHNTIEEVISENNGGIWEIQSLTIEVYEGDKIYSSSINLKIKFSPGKGPFWGSFAYESIELEIEGEDRDWVYLTSSQLEDRLKNIKIFTLTNFIFRSVSRLAFPVIFLLAGFLIIAFPVYGIFFGFSSTTQPLIPFSSIPRVDAIIGIVF